MGVSRAELLAIEEAAVRGWPALQSAVIDGWIWRHTSGGSVRANTVAALAFTGPDVEAAIAEVERRYRAAGAPPRFTISDVGAPVDLDARLAGRNYARGDEHVTMAKHGAPCPMPAPGVAAGMALSPVWSEVYHAALSPGRRRV